MGNLDWSGGVQWATSLGQFGIFAEFAVMGALWLAGIVVQQLFGSKKVAGDQEDTD